MACAGALANADPCMLLHYRGILRMEDNAQAVMKNIILIDGEAGTKKPSITP
jgi:hypothetical protein